MDYIPINSVDDLDVARISIRDINLRYIDRAGNRFATRFNPKTRKIEIVHIVKGRQEAIRKRQQIIREKSSTSSTHEEESHDDTYDQVPESAPDDYEFSGSVSMSAEAESAAMSAPFFENKFLEDTAFDLEKVKERSQGIINNLKKSRFFDNHSEAEFSEIVRDIDIACWQKSEEAVNYFRELYSYPRSVGYYAARLTDARRDKVEQIEGDEGKLELIRRWETQEVFENAYKQVVEVAMKLAALLKPITSENMKMLNGSQQQAFSDARSATDYLALNCKEMLQKIAAWKKRFP